jgi:hypothetical protein
MRALLIAGLVSTTVGVALSAVAITAHCFSGEYGMAMAYAVATTWFAGQAVTMLLTALDDEARHQAREEVRTPRGWDRI